MTVDPAAPTWPDVLTDLLQGVDLSSGVAAWAMDRNMSGEATSAQIAGFLIALRAKGETADELAGFVVACALVRPSRSLADLEVSSVKKKLKDKAFARNVNRDDIAQGTAELGVDLNDHITFVIGAMRGITAELGL